MKVLNEGPITNKLSDIQEYDFNDGFIQYKSLYIILDFNHVDERPFKNIVRLLARNASNNGKEFPIIVGDEEKAQIKQRFMICTPKGLPFQNNDYSTGYFNTIEEVMKALKSKINEGIDLKSKIKKALREDIKTRKSIRWDPDTQPNTYQLDLFLRKAGYRLVDVVIDTGKTELIIESMKEDHLTPNINHNVAEDKFYVTVKKYGELEASDVEEIIKGYQRAVEVIHNIEKLNLAKVGQEKEGDNIDEEPDIDSSEESARK